MTRAEDQVQGELGWEKKENKGLPPENYTVQCIASLLSLLRVDVGCPSDQPMIDRRVSTKDGEVSSRQAGG